MMEKNILVVEDDLSMQENIISLLEEEGYKCSKANNGLEAIDVLEKEKIDLVISDVMMPKLDGFGLFEHIQNHSEMHTIPFILLTAKVDITSLRKGMNLGVDDYITKPFKADDLMSAVKIRLAKKEKYRNEVEKLRENIVKYVPHELRTPLVSILGYSDFLFKEYDDLNKDQAMEMISSINKSGSRLFDRLEKFLILAELEVQETGEQIVKKTSDKLYSVDEQNVLKALVYSPEITERVIDLTLSLQNARINIAENHLLLVVKEIVSNACKFSNKGTKIFLKGKIKNGLYSIRVLDKGIGMSKDEIKELGAFKQFQREKYQQVGNGLGLFLVQRLLQIVNGSLSIHSINNKTLVEVKLPLAETDNHEAKMIIA